MKAAVIVAPHEVEIREVERPSPVPGEALVQIEAVGVCGSDLHAYEGTQPFFRYPQIGGHEVVGVFRERISAQPGEQLHVTLDPARIHLFDTKSGLRLPHA